jgi:hypothetical protein
MVVRVKEHVVLIPLVVSNVAQTYFGFAWVVVQCFGWVCVLGAPVVLKVVLSVLPFHSEVLEVWGSSISEFVDQESGELVSLDLAGQKLSEVLGPLHLVHLHLWVLVVWVASFVEIVDSLEFFEL